MRKLVIPFTLIGLLLVGCSQKEQIETSSPVEKSNSVEKTERLDIEEETEIALFSTAVNDSIKQPGIAEMVKPQYTFSLGDESYFLWIAEDNGTIMNTKDTHTIYSLSSHSVKEVNRFIHED